MTKLQGVKYDIRTNQNQNKRIRRTKFSGILIYKQINRSVNLGQKTRLSDNQQKTQNFCV